MGVAAGDFDNDGSADLYVTNFGANVLLKGDGRGHFADVTAKAGVASSGWSTSAAFLDYDADGDLDLFVAHYLNWQRVRRGRVLQPDRRARLLQPEDLRSAVAVRRSFATTATARSPTTPIAPGCAPPPATASAWSPATSTAMAAIDIFVANDGTPNHLWLNRGGGRFENAALAMGVRGRSGRQSQGGHGRVARRRGRRRRSRSARRQPRRRIGLVLSQRENILPRRRGGGGAADGRAGRSRGSARRCSTSTTTACSISTRRTAVSGGNRRCFPPIRTRSRTCCFAASRDRGSKR